MAILRYQEYDRLPLVYFTFWKETIDKWAAEGHLTPEEAGNWDHWSPGDVAVARKLGFDFCWGECLFPNTGLLPGIEERVVEELFDGSRKFLNKRGAIVLQKDGVRSIPAEFDHLLKGRKEWEEFFLPRLQFSHDRISKARVNTGKEKLLFDAGGFEYLCCDERESPVGLYCGSLYGTIRDWLGLTNLAYLYVDDPLLLDEIIETVGQLCYRCTEAALETGAKFDYAHFWEDICFKNGPLVNPKVFREKVGPHYRRITDLLNSHGIDIVSVDCDGQIDRLLPIWLECGVNTMFPVEVGTWHASITPWRAACGPGVRGVGGMDKRVFAQDCAAVEAEVERLKPLVELGGYIPCPDHHVPPDAKWENVKYYCERMREIF